MGTQASNVPQKKATPDGRGGILRVTEDGQQPLQRILGNGSQLNLYYAYGIRNSFGLDFDPVTGTLWDTENGPSFGDEINLVKPGFNSGWASIQGFWTLNDKHKKVEEVVIPTSINAGEKKDNNYGLVDFGG